MKVAVFPAAHDASGKYRLEWPSKELQAQGLDISIYYDRKFQRVMQPSPFGDKCVDILGDIDFDVAVFQRTLTRHLVELMHVLQSKGVAIVQEIDDGFSWLPLHNPARQKTDPFVNRDENWMWLEKACQMADWVTCTTDGLAEFYGSHGRVSVIPNYAPRWYTDIPRPELGDRSVIGWTGSVHTHGKDLQVTEGAIAKAVALTDARLRVVGTGEGVARCLKSGEPEATGWVDIEDYPVEMSKFDVGIVPLQMNRFNDQGKSWLKFLEFSALGIPCIASPTRDNLKLAHMGIGSIAENPEEWLMEATSLLLDKDWREERGAKTRQYVRDHLTIEGNAYQWTDAWRNAHAIRHGGLVDSMASV